MTIEEMARNIPTELQKLPQWVTRRGKIPYTPGTNSQAKAGVPETWGAFDEAMRAYRNGGFDGIGFEFADNGGIVGIDLDHVVDKDSGKIKNWALDIYTKMSSYTEYSPSGTGLHIFVYGDIPRDGRKKVINKETGEAIELYKAKRYFTVTGRPAYNIPIADRSAELAELYAELFPDQGQAASAPILPQNAPDYLQVGLDKDKRLLALWNGQRDTTDESSNDLALLNKLAYWCNKDEGLMIDAFMRSPFAAQKDEAHRKKLMRDDYLHRTAQMAINGCRSTAAEDSGTYRAKRDFAGLGSDENKAGSDTFLSCFKTLEEFEEQEATWLVPGWIPDGQITLVAADGGIGKTTLWCDIIAAISSGSRCILDPEDHTREPAKVAFLTTEDSVRKKLKRKLRLAGANERNIITPDFLSDKANILKNMKFGSDDMKRFIEYFRPVLCVYDPVQGFVPPDINMGSRNAMRDCMAPLISLGEEYGTTFLVICHTNKRKGAYGRDRIADSADLWDISRSVIMAGYTEEQGVRYISNEKNNYTQLQKTILFTIGESGIIQPCGTTWKRDREYMQENAIATSKPKREDCKDFIVHTLKEHGGSIKTKELEALAKENGYSHETLRRAKGELKDDNVIKYVQKGYENEKEWYIYRQEH